MEWHTAIVPSTCAQPPQAVSIALTEAWKELANARLRSARPGHVATASQPISKISEYPCPSIAAGQVLPHVGGFRDQHCSRQRSQCPEARSLSAALSVMAAERARVVAENAQLQSNLACLRQPCAMPTLCCTSGGSSTVQVGYSNARSHALQMPHMLMGGHGSSSNSGAAAVPASDFRSHHCQLKDDATSQCPGQLNPRTIPSKKNYAQQEIQERHSLSCKSHGNLCECQPLHFSKSEISAGNIDGNKDVEQGLALRSSRGRRLIRGHVTVNEQRLLSDVQKPISMLTKDSQVKQVSYRDCADDNSSQKQSDSSTELRTVHGLTSQKIPPNNEAFCSSRISLLPDSNQRPMIDPGQSCSSFNNQSSNRDSTKRQKVQSAQDVGCSPNVSLLPEYSHRKGSSDFACSTTASIHKVPNHAVNNGPNRVQLRRQRARQRAKVRKLSLSRSQGDLQSISLRASSTTKTSPNDKSSCAIDGDESLQYPLCRVGESNNITLGVYTSMQRDASVSQDQKGCSERRTSGEAQPIPRPVRQNENDSAKLTKYLKIPFQAVSHDAALEGAEEIYGFGNISNISQSTTAVSDYSQLRGSSSRSQDGPDFSQKQARLVNNDQGSERVPEAVVNKKKKRGRRPIYETEEERDAVRALRNRASASRHRQRSRERNEALEQQIVDLQLEHDHLSKWHQRLSTWFSGDQLVAALPWGTRAIENFFDYRASMTPSGTTPSSRGE